jgi:hypothetical protein
MKPYKNMDGNSPTPTTPSYDAGQDKRKSYNDAYLFFVILVILFVGMFAYIFFRPSQKQTAKVPPSPLPTQAITWKSYTNPQYGYAIDYLSNWSLQKKGKSGQILDASVFSPPSGKAGPIAIRVYIKSYQNFLTNKTLVDAEKTITVNSVNVTEQVEHDSAGNQTLIAIFPFSDNVITVTANSNDGALFNHMVESMRFRK